jgi:hypothetical protein
MKRMMFIAAFLVNAGGLCAQESAAEREVRQLEITEHQAMLKRDVAALKNIWAADFMVNTPVNRISLSSQELFDLIGAGVFNYTSFTRDIEKVMVKDHLVITMGSETVVPVGKNDKAGKTIKRRYTNIWIKDKGTWKLTARHANEIN